jgi:hypothetical protein
MGNHDHEVSSGNPAQECCAFLAPDPSMGGVSMAFCAAHHAGARNVARCAVLPLSQPEK